MTKVAYLALPTSAFTTLQKKVFPVYFQLQSLLLVATALTYPPTSVLALFRAQRQRRPRETALSGASQPGLPRGPVPHAPPGHLARVSSAH